MASSTLSLHLSPSTTVSRRATKISSIANRSSDERKTVSLPTRRQCLTLLLLSSSALALPATAEDIPLFGLRKKLKKIEEEAEEIVKEGEKAVEQEIELAEKGIEAAKAGVQSGLIQAAAVAAADAVGVIVGVSIVNKILGPEAQKS